jgi:predicted acyltransferase
MPLYRRLAIFIVLLLLLIAFWFIRGLAPVLRQWFGDWKTQAG